MKYKHEAEGLDLHGFEGFEVYRADIDDRVKYPRKWLLQATTDEIAALGFVAYEPEPEPEPEPSTDPNDYPLEPFQFFAMVEILGKADEIESAIDKIENPVLRAVVRAKFQHGSKFHRSATAFAVLAPLIELSNEQIDAAWMQAKDIQ